MKKSLFMLFLFLITEICASQQVSSQSGRECVALCFDQTADLDNLTSPNERENSPNLPTGKYDSDTLRIMCNSAVNFTACANRCEDSPFKFAMIRGQSPIAYICESGMISKAQCWKNAVDVTNDTCEAMDKCGGLMRSYLATRNPPFESTKISCQYMKCSNDCRKPTVTANCGQKMAEDIENFVSLYIQMRFKENDGRPAEVDFPECNQLIKNAQ